MLAERRQDAIDQHHIFSNRALFVAGIVTQICELLLSELVCMLVGNNSCNFFAKCDFFRFFVFFFEFLIFCVETHIMPSLKRPVTQNSGAAVVKSVQFGILSADEIQRLATVEVSSKYYYEVFDLL